MLRTVRLQNTPAARLACAWHVPGSARRIKECRGNSLSRLAPRRKESPTRRKPPPPQSRNSFPPETAEFFAMKMPASNEAGLCRRADEMSVRLFCFCCSRGFRRVAEAVLGRTRTAFSFFVCGRFVLYTRRYASGRVFSASVRDCFVSRPCIPAFFRGITLT